MNHIVIHNNICSLIIFLIIYYAQVDILCHLYKVHEHTGCSGAPHAVFLLLATMLKLSIQCYSNGPGHMGSNKEIQPKHTASLIKSNFVIIPTSIVGVGYWHHTLQLLWVYHPLPSSTRGGSCDTTAPENITTHSRFISLLMPSLSESHRLGNFSNLGNTFRLYFVITARPIRIAFAGQLEQFGQQWRNTAQHKQEHLNGSKQPLCECAKSVWPISRWVISYYSEHKWW